MSQKAIEEGTGWKVNQISVFQTTSYGGASQ